MDIRETFKLTKKEMRLIRVALDREAKRKEEINSPQTKDYKELADLFERRIRNIKNI